ncbi:MAG: SAM-dependent chlorinase/fluorinase [Gemmataceae bacterium]
MAERLVTLTTDFGEGSSYVAAMKGALLSVNPAAHIVDLTHSIPPQDISAAALFLADSLPHFPIGTIHVVVVDPGVGTNRALLFVEWSKQRILAPDNGCWTALAFRGKPRVRQIVERRFFGQHGVSPTFHGRDILAPVAGHLSRGQDPAELGQLVRDWVRLELPRSRDTPKRKVGIVLWVDAFGNLITNIEVRSPVTIEGVQVGSASGIRVVHTFGDAKAGDLVALVGSSGRLEVAVVNGSAASYLGLGRGAEVVARLR